MTAAATLKAALAAPRPRAGVPLWLWAIALIAVVAQLAGQGVAIWTGLALFLLGFAHGAAEEAGDTLRAPAPATIAFYLVTGAAFAALYLALPLVGLAAFLALSCWHFARSDTGLPPIANAAIALLSIGGTALLQPAATSAILAAMIGIEPPHWFMLLLAIAGATGVLLALASLRATTSPLIAAAACALLHPVLAVGAIFLAAHALPVQAAQARQSGWRAVLSAQAPATIAALAGSAVLVALYRTGNVLLGWLVAAALGIAIPHVLVDGLEFSAVPHPDTSR